MAQRISARDGSCAPARENAAPAGLAGPRDVASLDEFRRLPEVKPALEFDGGRTVQKVSPKGRHSRLQLWIAGLFDGAGRSSKTALAFPELRSTFAGRSYVPDVSVYRWHRIPRTASGEVADEFLLPPDIAVEIVSPEQGVAGVADKCAWYVANGVEVALLVNPGERAVRLYRMGQEPITLRDADSIDVSDVVPGVRVTVDDLFAALRLD